MNRVNVADADSGGVNGPVNVPEGWTVGDYFASRKGGRDIKKYHITVDNRPATAQTELPHGCYLVISPAKLAGAR